MSIDPQEAISRAEHTRRMINDPDLTGTTLLFALALDEVCATRDERHGVGTMRRWLHQVETLALGGTDTTTRPGAWVKRIIADEVPRYEPEQNTWLTQCPAPMIRRDGPCGKRATTLTMDYDPDTGRRWHTGACNRHRTLLDEFEQHRQQWIANGKPDPPPNAGGVLERYFDTDWARLYAWAAPDKIPAYERREPTPPRPRLRIIQGGAS